LLSTSVSVGLKLFKDFRRTKGLNDCLEASREADKPETSGGKVELFADDNELANSHPQTARLSASRLSSRGLRLSAANSIFFRAFVFS